MKADQFLPEDTTLRSSKYLNNLIEQDHRNIKSRANAMPGFNRFWNAAITISGVEFMHRIRKDQFNLARLRLKDATAPLLGRQSFQHDNAMMNMPLSARTHNLPHSGYPALSPDFSLR